MKDFLLTALAYAGWFFVACAAVVALTWFALGLWNLAKIYFDAWKAKKEYRSEIPDFKTTAPVPDRTKNHTVDAFSYRLENEDNDRYIDNEKYL